MKKIVVLIPCYNAEKHCKDVISKTLQYATQLILVDDGSTDTTPSILNQFAKDFPEKILVISSPHNQGKGFALIEGMKKSLEYPFDALVTLDADEQHLPSEIPLFTQSIFEGNQMAIGVRNSDRMPFRSKFSNRFIAKILSLLYKQAPTDNQSGFRAFSFEFTKKIVQLISGGRYEMEFKCILFALKNNIKIDSIPITTIYLKQPTSYFNIFLDSFLILKVFFNHWRTGEI